MVTPGPHYWMADAVVAERNALAWPWVAVALIALGVIAVIVALIVTRRPARPPDPAQDSQRATVWVANSQYLASVPALRQWTRRYRAWQAVAALSALVAVGALAVLAARPVKVQEHQATLASRDIVLCLDVSGSMLEYDRQMINAFRQMVASFDGERISLAVFNEVTRVIFPLTDDYALVTEQLDEAYEALDPELLYAYDPTTLPSFTKYLELTAGTYREQSDNASLIGDGLAGCVFEFDDVAAGEVADTQTSTDPSAGPSASPTDPGTSAPSEPQERSRSIVLATDNDLRGTPVFTLDEALALAQERDIEINALFGDSAWVVDPNAETKYRQSVTQAGGYFYYAADSDAVADIIGRVQRQQAIDLGAATEITITDAPGNWLWVALLACLVTALAVWRVRE